MTLKVALLGYHGGIAREYNPGSFMIGWQTHRELSRRLPGARIDLFSFDTGSEYDDVLVENEGGLTIRFFCKHRAAALLDETLADYDAVVVGGDNVWSTADPKWVFFLPSEKLLAAKKPAVLFNCVSTIRPKATIEALRPAITAVCKRAAYVAVRAHHLHDVVVKDFGLADVLCLPDPVLGADPAAIAKAATRTVLPPSSKPKLGVAISPAIANATIEAFARLEKPLEKFEVWIYEFTRLYQQLESVTRMKKAFGDRFRYIERPLGPLESYDLVGQFDLSFNDTYHGTIAGIVQKRPFITTRYRDPATSRRSQLFALLGMKDDAIPFQPSAQGRPAGYAAHVPIAVLGGAGGGLAEPLPGRHREDVERLVARLTELLERPQRVPEDALARVRERLDEHWNAMAGIIARSG